MAINRRAQEEVGTVDADIADAVVDVLEPVDSEVEIPQAPEATHHAVAVHQEAPAPAVTSERTGDVVSQLADEGFEGLEINFTSFDVIILEKSAFASASGKKVKEDFEVVLQKTRSKFLFSSLHADTDKTEAVYSYNEHADTQDPEVMAKIAAWKEQDGVGYTKKRYIEALAIMVDDKGTGELNNEMVLLQIPPASIGKISGHIVQGRMKGYSSPSEYTTIVGVGPKVGEGQKAFYPWVFSIKKTK